MILPFQFTGKAIHSFSMILEIFISVMAMVKQFLHEAIKYFFTDSKKAFYPKEKF